MNCKSGLWHIEIMGIDRTGSAYTCRDSPMHILQYSPWNIHDCLVNFEGYPLTAAELCQSITLETLHVCIMMLGSNPTLLSRPELCLVPGNKQINNPIDQNKIQVKKNFQTYLQLAECKAYLHHVHMYMYMTL